MTRQVEDLHISGNTPLPTPLELHRELPPSEAQAATVAGARDAIAAILTGHDPRLLVIVGPCSIHDTTAGRAYAARLAALAAELRERLLIVMRVYFEKPRTTVGWKGLIMDPHLDGSDDIPAGLRLARSFLREVLDLGLPTATELLDPITPQYIADLVCWAAIGARTTESQTHRQMASGLSMPVGFKNATSGDLGAAINAVLAASRPQTFLGVSHHGVASAVTTTGNPHCHIILRGGTQGPNYTSHCVADACAALAAASLPARVMVDASHANCAKDHTRMPAVVRDLLAQHRANPHSLSGIMLESNLLAGSQPFPVPRHQLTYGQSITDPCIDWESTATLLREAAGS